jgi:hypothetical protein
MPYDPTDSRAQMAPAAATIGVPRPAQYRELRNTAPDESHPVGSVTWLTRGQSLVVAYTDARTGECLTTDATCTGEHVVLVLDGAHVTIEHDAETVHVDEPSLVIVPPGPSAITVEQPGTVVRLFAVPFASELADRSANSAEFDQSDPNVAPFVAWPDPPDGFRLRVYPFSAHPFEEGRFGRIFRCSTLMVNVLPEDGAPRDPTKLSPHHHDDFEQISLQAHGDYVHHMRAPWTPDSSTWQDDEHHHCVAPAVVVIPPILIHTSQAVEHMHHWLIDVFAPPRFDFSNRPGWVINADEYPMPSDQVSASPV